MGGSASHAALWMGMSSEIDDDEDDFDEPLSDDAPLPDEDLDEFEAEAGDLDDDASLELDPKERAARSLEVRRAIESRLEERRLREDLDYLDLEGDDFDD